MHRMPVSHGSLWHGRTVTCIDRKQSQTAASQEVRDGHIGTSTRLALFCVRQPTKPQACKAVAHARELVLTAQPPQSAEALALRQAESLGRDLPRPADSIHHQRVTASLAALGAPSRLHAGLGPGVAAALHEATPLGGGGEPGCGLPDDLRALCVYVSPDRATLYVAAINMPDLAAAAEAEAKAAEAAAAGNAAGGGGKGGAKAGGAVGSKGKGKEEAPKPSGPKRVVLDAVPLDVEMLDGLRNDMRAYRR